MKRERTILERSQNHLSGKTIDIRGREDIAFSANRCATMYGQILKLVQCVQVWKMIVYRTQCNLVIQWCVCRLSGCFHGAATFGMTG